MSIFCLLERNVKTVNNKDPKNVELEVVNLGFSWPAFFFNIVWALSNKIYFYSFICTISIILIALLSVLTSNFLLLLIFLVMSSVYWGLFGSSILTDNLIKRRYQPLKLINSTNSFQALLLFLADD